VRDLDVDYWESRYRNNEIGWDIGDVSLPIASYINQIDHKHLKILIPGAGNAYEAFYLIAKGFHDVTVCDVAKQPIYNIISLDTEKKIKVIHGDFFELTGTYDLIIEQTFFCALNPKMRSYYVTKMRQLLQPRGKLIGVLFSSHFDKEGPPFGGDLEEYLLLFSEYFIINKLEACYNSIIPRRGNEFFINFTVKEAKQ
jgi:thiopurine S-methyltransferase